MKIFFTVSLKDGVGTTKAIGYSLFPDYGNSIIVWNSSDPYIAEVTLNDVSVNNNSNIWLEPGSYTDKVKCDHFSSIERTIEISNDYHYIVGILSATDDDGR